MMHPTRLKPTKVACLIVLIGLSGHLTACSKDAAQIGGGSEPATAALDTMEDQPQPGYGYPQHQGTVLTSNTEQTSVCHDSNVNMRCDVLEKSTLTNGNGSFTLRLDKTESPLLASYALGDTTVRLIAAPFSANVSSLTTLLQWSITAHPQLNPFVVRNNLEELLGVAHLDAEDLTLLAQAPSTSSSAQSLHTDQDLARQAVELLIKKTSKQATTDTLQAGLDPQQHDGQKAFQRVIADQTLRLLPQLATQLHQTILSSDLPSAQSMVDALEPIRWPGGNIEMAMAFFATEPPIESNPIALLNNGITALHQTCESSDNCKIQQQRYALDTAMQLQYSDNTTAITGDKVLSDTGEWVDMAGEASALTTVASPLELTVNGPLGNFACRTAVQDISGIPTLPLVEKLGISIDETIPNAPEFSPQSKLVSLYKERLTDQFRLHTALPNVERHIGNSPSRLVLSLDELMDTASDISLTNIHPDYTLTLHAPNGADRGYTTWSRLSALSNKESIQSFWRLSYKNGIPLMEFTIPAKIAKQTGRSQLFIAVYENQVKAGTLYPRGERSTELTLNDAALSAIIQ